MASLPFHIPNPFKQEPPTEPSPKPATSSQPKSSLAKNDSKNEQTLETLLPTASLRSSLTLLIATLTTQMRSDITAIFDPRFVNTSAPPLASNPLEDKQLNLSKVDVEAEDKAREQREKIVEELSAPEVQALKKEALAFYDGWRVDVLTRVGEVVNSRGEAVAQAKEVAAKGEVKPVETAKDEDVKIGDEQKGEAKEEFRNESAEKMLKELYHPVDTPLMKELDQDKRRLVLHAVMLLLLSLEHYAAYSRVLLLNLASSLDIPLGVLSEDESSTARSLLTAAELSADAETKKKAEENASSRKWKVGLATAAGAALIGVTGGLAAPLVAAGVGSVMGGIGLASTTAATYLGALAGSEILIAGLFGAYGGKMTGKMMDEFAKEVDDFAFVPVHKMHRPRKIENEYRRLRVAICISGWLTEKEDVVRPWRVMSTSIEGFALRWELEALLKLGNAITGMLRTTAWAYAKAEIIKHSLFAVLFSALWPLKIMKAAHVVDNPFSVAMVRADKAGEVLAEALANKVQGERPVTLIGYSLGARVIYTCLLRLAERKLFGLVESVVLLGGPLPAHHWDWRQMRSVVAGRLVNVHSENDLVLAFLYRTHSLEYGVAGLQKIEGVKGVENVDVSDLISGHLRYRFLTGSVLRKIGFEDLDIELIEQEEAEMKAMEEVEEKEREKQEEKDKKGHKNEDEQVKELESDVEKRNEASTMDWAKAKLVQGKDAFGALWGSKEEEAKDEKSTAQKKPEVKKA